ncbi:cysteine proteinase, partial [Neoconidiobolus thromboides FSU 785]
LFNDVKIFTKNSTIASRGIINHNLLCYANSTLQALLHCPPFFNLLRMIAPVVKVPQNSNTLDAPILTALLEFYEEYKNIPKHGYIEPIHPSFIISIVKSLGERFKTQIGQQEDAHEFLDILLNGLDEEFLSIFKKGDFKMNSKILQQKDIVIHITKEMNSMDIEEDGDDWVGVGAKNKQFIDRGFKMVNTPITALFSCIYSSTLKCTGEKPKVSHNSSIYLQLEIEPSHIDSVEDAIIHLLEPETIEEKGSITTTKQVSIKALPPILVLQLKNVNYDPLYGQVKIKKELDYPLVLTIPPPEVSLKSKSIPPTQYKLISVIYHHGNEAMAGHYTCDVRYGDDAWFYFNDELVEKLKPESVGTSEHTYDGSPYLLFYQRV